MTSHRLLCSLACATAGIVVAVHPAMAGGAGDATQTTTTIVQSPGNGETRIEVTGNTAANVRTRCRTGATQSGAAQSGAAQSGVNVNSVNVEGRALRGKTVIVTGRNSRDVDVDVDCDRGAGGAGSSANVNSVNIR